MSKQMFVYIMANTRPNLYAGVTDNLILWVQQHKEEKIEGFTKKYHINKLVYYEAGEGPMNTIIREKQIKDMDRKEKLEMIQKFNPTLRDLYEDILKS